MSYSIDRIDSYFGKPLVVLALWQPVATLCVAPDPENNGEPAKRHETRHWYPYGELPISVAIHAAKRFDAENRDSFTAPRFKEALKRSGFYPGDPREFTKRKMDPPMGLKPVPLGAIIGVATIAKLFSAMTIPPEAIAHGVQPLRLDSLTDDDRAFGYFVRRVGVPGLPDDPHPYRYAWRLENTLLLPEPIPHSGRQEALYPVDVHLLDQITAQLRQLREVAS